MLPNYVNPLLQKATDPTNDLVDVVAPTIHRRQVALARRELRDVRRAKTAAAAVGPLTRDVEVYGFTKGQFSVIDLIAHALDHIGGPADLQIVTWTAGNTDVGAIMELLNSGKIATARWLVDISFNRRDPELAQRIRNQFGDDAIRVAKNHAKFILLAAGDWRVVIRTSMNLNFNPRFENFQIAHDPELFDFHAQIIDEVWRKQDRRAADLLKPYDLAKQFDADL